MLLTVQRAGEVLELFHLQGEWGVSEVAKELGVAKSQSHDLLASLCSIGLLRRFGRGRYRLGWGAVYLGRQLLRDEFRGNGGIVAVKRLANATRQSSYIVAMDRSQIFVLASWRGDNTDPEALHNGEELGRALGGRLLRSVQDDEPGLASRGPVIDEGRTAPGYCAVAAPVVGRDNQVVAALALSATESHWRGHQRELRVLVHREAERLSAHLRAEDLPLEVGAAV